jgi:hypothetical protein
MRDEYDFSESMPNPYVKNLKPQVTIPVEDDVIQYFQQLAEETGIPYQNLMYLYLKDCVRSKRKPSLEWVN